jgi:hypothetical protein
MTQERFSFRFRLAIDVIGPQRVIGLMRSITGVVTVHLERTQVDKSSHAGLSGLLSERLCTQHIDCPDLIAGIRALAFGMGSPR